MNGRLVKCVEFWTNELKANSYILDVISNGYQIPFRSSPTKIFLKNNKSSLEHKDFVVSSILELLENVCIKEVQNPPFCVNPLTVSVNSLGKKRLFLDLRQVNQQIIARQIFDFCFIKSIILEVAWIPRQFNQLSDFFSKDFDYDDWGVSQ